MKLTPHGAFYPDVLGRKLRPYIALLKPFFYGRLAAFHAVSPGEERIIRSLFRQKTYVVPNGVSADPCFQPPAEPQDLDTRDPAITLVCVGRLDVQTKGLDILLQALAGAVVQSPRRLKLVLVGSGNDDSSIRSMIDQLISRTTFSWPA